MFIIVNILYESKSNHHTSTHTKTQHRAPRTMLISA